MRIPMLSTRGLQSRVQSFRFFVTLSAWVGLIGTGPQLFSQVQTVDPPQNEKANLAQEISPSDAKSHVGKKCVLEFKVESSILLKDKHICFLNSQANHRDEANFSVVIVGEESLKRFADKEMSDPAASYRGKTIRIEGVISLHRGSPQIKVDSPDEIKVIEDVSK